MLINILVSNFRSIVAPNNIWAFDELMFPHQARHDPIVAFIPRKPHQVGIIAYLATVLLTHTQLPFVMHLFPVTSDNGLSGPHAFQSFLAEIPSMWL